jgi:hypothetical protein
MANARAYILRGLIRRFESMDDWRNPGWLENPSHGFNVDRIRARAVDFIRNEFDDPDSAPECVVVFCDYDVFLVNLQSEAICNVGRVHDHLPGGMELYSAIEVEPAMPNFTQRNSR